MSVAPIPEGFNTITPTLVVSDGKKAIDTYVKAFGAKEAYRMEEPNTGKIMHACLRFGTSNLFLCDTNPQCATVSASHFYLYFDNVDAVFAQATKAGLKEKSAPQDMFWGDRTGTVTDAFGNSWTIATHVRDVSPQEIQETAKKMSAKAA